MTFTDACFLYSCLHVLHIAADLYYKVKFLDI